MYPHGIVDDRDGGVMTTRRRMTARQPCKHCYFRLTLAANMAQRTFANRLYDSMGEEQTKNKQINETKEKCDCNIVAKRAHEAGATSKSNSISPSDSASH